jgi:two-component system cell cycle sensor histidine kinase/response regulator CckA
MSNAVEQNKKRFRGIFDNIQDVYYEASLEGTLIEVSPSIEKFSHYRRESLIGT